MNPPSQSLQQKETTISIEHLSPKQLLGECVDLATMMLKEIIGHFTESNGLENPFLNQKADFSAYVNYILDPTRLETIINQFVKQEEKSFKAFARSWIFELKNLRNCWAHSDVITQRLAIRGFDTLSLFYQLFSGDPNTQMFNKIEFYRKNLLIVEAKTYL